jgi:Ca2+-binding EF-hand superfamily protein
MVMDVIDKDHDRGIDYAEFCSSFRRAAKARALARDVTLEVQSKLRHHQAKLLTIFSSFDTNGDGVLSLDELRSGLRQLGIHLSTEELRRLMEVIDKDGDAQIDYQEFLAIACEDQSPQSDLRISSGERSKLECADSFDSSDSLSASSRRLRQFRPRRFRAVGNWPTHTRYSPRGLNSGSEGLQFREGDLRFRTVSV